MKRFVRKCPGVYEVGDIAVESVWHPEHRVHLWHVIRNGKTVSSHGYLRHAKAEAMRLANTDITNTPE